MSLHFFKRGTEILWGGSGERDYFCTVPSAWCWQETRAELSAGDVTAACRAAARLPLLPLRSVAPGSARAAGGEAAGGPGWRESTGFLFGSITGMGPVSAGSLLVTPTGTAMGAATTRRGDDVGAASSADRADGLEGTAVRGVSAWPSPSLLSSSPLLPGGEKLQLPPRWGVVHLLACWDSAAAAAFSRRFVAGWGGAAEMPLQLARAGQPCLEGCLARRLACTAPL